MLRRNPSLEQLVHQHKNKSTNELYDVDDGPSMSKVLKALVEYDSPAPLPFRGKWRLNNTDLIDQDQPNTLLLRILGMSLEAKAYPETLDEFGSKVIISGLVLPARRFLRDINSTTRIGYYAEVVSLRKNSLSDLFNKWEPIKIYDVALTVSQATLVEAVDLKNKRFKR
jgi:hypothetical protein